MALKLYERYPQLWESPSNDYPQGAFKNLSAQGETDGSYLEKDWLNDYSGFFGALLKNAQMTPDGTIDTAQRSQFYDALVKVAKSAVADQGYATKTYVDNKFNEVPKTEIINNWDQASDENVFSAGFAAKYLSRNIRVNPSMSNILEIISNNSIIYFCSGTYVFNESISLLNKSIICEPEVIFDFTNNPKVSCFNANGVKGNDVNVTSVQGDIVTVEDSSLFNVGDTVILQSLTQCDDPVKAGDKWCLGAGTAGASTVYFGEPVTVSKIAGNTLTLSSNVLFPESYTTKFTGVVAKLGKVTWGSADILGYPKLILSDNLHQYGFVGRYLNHPRIELYGVASHMPSQLVRMSYTLLANVTGKCERPVNWILQEDHSKYNSWVFQSCWFSNVDVIEVNGSQSLDQSYGVLPSLCEEFKVVSINPKEMGMTTHGMSYKSRYDVRVSGNTTSGMQNRARFSDIKLSVTGNKSERSTGLSLQDWGMTDVVADVDIDSCFNGVRFSKSFNAVSSTASVVRAKVTGRIGGCSKMYSFESKQPESIGSSSSIRLEADGFNNNVIVSSSEGGWNKRHLKGSLNIGKGQDIAVSMGNPTFGNTISNADFSGGRDGMSYIGLFSAGSNSDFVGTAIDFKTTTFDGNNVKSTEGNSFGYSLNTAQSLLTTRKLSNLDKVIILAGNNANSTLTIPVDSSIPVDKMITLIPRSIRIKIEGEEGVTINDLRSQDSKPATIYRMPNDTYFVM